MKKNELNKKKILDRISEYNKQKSLFDISINFLKFCSIIILVVFILSLSQSIFYFSKNIRFSLVIILSLFSIVLFIKLLFQPIKNLLNRKSLSNINLGAKEIGDRFPDIKDNLLNSIQLILSKEFEKSKLLINAAFEKIYNDVKHLNFLSTINFHPIKKNILSFFSINILIVILFLTFSNIKIGAYRLFSINTEFEKPKEFSLQVTSGNKSVRKGENVTLHAVSSGKAPSDIFIAAKSSSDAEYSNHNVKLDSNNGYTLSLKNIQNSTKYFAYKKDVITDTFTIAVTSPPVISKLNFEIIPPSYSKLPITNQENNGNITALKGTKVNYNFESTKSLKSAYRISANEDRDTLKLVDKVGSGKITVRRDEKYYFELVDLENISNNNPIDYTIQIIPDRFPEINISRPEQISLIPSNDIVSINYSIKDDFGFSKLLLKYKIELSDVVEDSTEFNDILLKIDKDEVEQVLYYNWDVSRLNLRENELISFYLVVADNDFVSGPKLTKSDLYKLRVPSLEELFMQAENTQETAIEELNETLQQAEELQKEIHQISNELKQDEKEIDWNEKERIEETLTKYKEITEKIENIQDNLDEMRKQMTENNLLSEETMQKYNELQDLMEEINSEELQKALENMQKSLEKLMRDKVQQSLDNLSMNEKMFQKSIERTLNLLKKIQIEQKIDEMIKRTEKISEDLEKLKTDTEDNLEKNETSEQQSTISEQKNVQDQLNSLNEEMSNLESKMSDVSDAPLEAMKELNKNFDEQKNMELAQEALEKLQDQNPFEALMDQEQLSQNMQNMMEQMSAMQQQMQQQSQQMVMQNMLKAIDNIITLSKEQESLKNKTDNSRSQPRELPKLTQEQMDLQQSLDNILKQLSELSQKTFAITPEMGNALGKARRNMNESISGLQTRNHQKSNFSQGESIQDLNVAATMLQQSLQAMMQGNGGQGGGMMSLMQQLQQMAQQQMGLNKLTQMMQQGQLTMQQQAQLQRLAQEQAAIQKSLAELNKEAKTSGQSKKITADLEKVIDDMKEVISGLNTSKIDDDLIKTQEKILTKLLDAQRSINERDFEKNRESFTGKNFESQSPSELILSKDRAVNILREELLRSIQNGYSKDYEDLIRRYFEKINEITIQN